MSRPDPSTASDLSAEMARPRPVWLTVPDVAARVQCGPKVIYRAVKRRQLRAVRIDGRGDLRFREEWVDAWLEAAATPLDTLRV